jgi:hypothetical protein
MPTIAQRVLSPPPLTDGMPRVELDGGVFTVRLIIPANDGDWHLSDANEPPPLRL